VTGAKSPDMVFALSIKLVRKSMTQGTDGDESVSWNAHVQTVSRYFKTSMLIFKQVPHAERMPMHVFK
jgi:hypothetical protein